MSKKIITVAMISMSLFFILSCATSKQETEEPKKEEINQEENKSFDTAGYEKAEFIKLNISDEELKNVIGNKVFVEGKASSLDLEGRVFDKSPNFLIAQEEQSGFGIYAVFGYEIKDSNIDIKEGDVIKVYGIVYPEKIAFAPTILVDHIEKVN